eukprot:jgi/Psemu1/326171/estExt_fgenesh1_pg.C_3420003
MREASTSRLSNTKLGAQQLEPQKVRNPLLPKQLYTVIGHETSGTHFFTDIITKALEVGEFRNGHHFYKEIKYDEEEIRVLHISMPLGLRPPKKKKTTRCQKTENIPIQGPILPSRCSKKGSKGEKKDPDSSLARQCKALAKDSGNAYDDVEKRVVYPCRYIMDIESNIEWYKSQGVDQKFVIVVRDQKISRIGSARYNKKKNVKQREDELSNQIMARAINKYILGEEITPFETWRDSLNLSLENGEKDLYGNIPSHSPTPAPEDAGRKLFSSSPLMHGNNVVLVSYESLIELGDVYVKLLYKSLGIESDYMPEIRDGNQKYVTKPAKH